MPALKYGKQTTLHCKRSALIDILACMEMITMGPKNIPIFFKFHSSHLYVSPSDSLLLLTTFTPNLALEFSANAASEDPNTFLKAQEPSPLHSSCSCPCLSIQQRFSANEPGPLCLTFSTAACNRNCSGPQTSSRAATSPVYVAPP